uniref:Ig-like domain-containing protein n=1 Tax=uncultured Flavobacterium sp. TaxID=165435 RepID=UPI0030CA3EDA
MKNYVFFKIILFLLIFIPKTIYAIDPPKITATGNQTYCSGTSLPIVETVSISFDPLEPTTDVVNIQISSGYVFGQDLLSLTGTNPGILYSWSASEGKLQLFSTSKLPYADFEAAIKNVMFSNSSSAPSGTRTFSISLGTGQLSYLPRNKHFYEYVSSPGITWTAARDAAAALNYYGLQGYLATLTAADEAQLAGAQAPGAGWIGGSDAAVEGTWKWVTGPEAGTVMTYTNWNNGEPNNAGNEDYAHITYGVGPKGSWNDLPNTGDTNPGSAYYPQGYIVEFGGMITGDVDNIQISASTTITIPKITSTTPSSICGPGVLTLQATASNGNLDWYTNSTGGTPLYTGNSFTTPNLTITTTFYVDASNGSCPNGPRTGITATIVNLPNLPQIAISSASPVLYCLNGNTIPLAAIPSTNCTLNWYTLPIGGVASATSPTPTTTVSGSTSYYVSQTNTITNCEGPRAAIIVTVNPLPTAPIVSNISYCNNETAVPLTAIATANCTLNWYTSATGGTPSATSQTPSTTIVNTTKYYVSQTITATGCEGPRSEIAVTVNPLPIAPIVSNIAYCNNETAIPLLATIDANCTLNWYLSPTGGSSSAISPTPLTATVGTTKYYVSQTLTATGCEGPRSEIIVTVNPLPVVNDVTIVQCDSDLIPDGKTLFNLKIKNNEISANYTNENFTYYTSQSGANSGLSTDLIFNDLAFENTTPSNMYVWSRVANKTTGCFSVAKLTLKVPTTNLLPSYKIMTSPVCDDFLDTNGSNNVNNDNRDGIATFDFSWTKATILDQLPPTQDYTINYYGNKADALAQLNVIEDISNYRNIGYPYSQDVWVRVESSIDNSCVGLGPYITLNVEALPFANSVIIPRQCDDNQDGIVTFNTSTLESTLLGTNQTYPVTVAYFDVANNPLKDANGTSIISPFPATFATTSQTIKAVVTNNTSLNCFDETTIQFIVDDLPEAFAVPVSLTTI